MTVHSDTVRPAVERWSEGRKPVWTAAEIDAVCSSIIAGSDAVTPHLVKDAALADEEQQAFLLARVEAAIDVWLLRAAVGLRGTLGITPPLRTADGALRVGLRGATDSDLIGLPGVGRVRARDIARMLALHPDVATIDDLDALDSVGDATMRSLQENAYLDQAAVCLISASLLEFCRDPGVPTFLALLDESQLELGFGDSNAWARRPIGGGGTVERFLRSLELVFKDAERRRSPASGVLASRAGRYLRRQTVRAAYVERLTPSDGRLVVNEAFLATLVDLIAASQFDIRLAIFLATAAPGEEPGTGSLAAIEALEARAAAGVSVRVILDRDEPDAPYLSSIINHPVVRRLRAAGVAVKQDEPAVLLHSKFLVADNASVVVGSHNLTRASLENTNELSVRLDSVPVAKAFAARFDGLWGSLQ